MCCDAAGVFSAGGPRLGLRRGAGRHVLWEGTAGRAGDLWTDLVAASGPVCADAVGWRVCGIVCFAVAAAACAGTGPGLIRKRVGELTWN